MKVISPNRDINVSGYSEYKIVRCCKCLLHVSLCKAMHIGSDFCILKYFVHQGRDTTSSGVSTSAATIYKGLSRLFLIQKLTKRLRYGLNNERNEQGYCLYM